MRKWINPVLVVNVILLVTIGRAYLAEQKGEPIPVQQDYETERPEEKSGGENEERPKPSASEMTLQFDNGRLIKIELYLNSDEDVTVYKEDGKIDENRGGHGYKAKKIVLEVIP